MAITFTSTKPGSSADYMRYVYGDISGIQKTDRYMDGALLDFALVPADAGYVHLNRGAYIKVNSATYPNWFTGYITNEAEASYLGKSNGAPVFGYKYQATSDEYILSLKPLGSKQPFLNVRMGVILKTLAEIAAPGVFDLSGIQDGPLVSQYVVTPDKLFKDVAKDLCDQASYLFYGNNHKLYFRPQDDAALGSIVIDGTNKHFTPSRLQIKASASPIVNDATVLGQLEPQTYMHEYFLGTGLESSFPLTAGVYGADTSILLQETFGDTSISSSMWSVYEGGSLVTSSTLLQTFNNYLQVLGGPSNGSYGLWLQSASAIPMDGHLRFTHGEWDWLSGGNGFIGALWTQEPNASMTGCLYGLQASGYTLKPIVSGSVDTTQFVTVSPYMRYIIRTVAEFSKAVRTPNKYTYLDSNGTVNTITDTSSQPDTVTWQTLISEVDPNTGTLTNHWAFKNTATLDGVTDTSAIYTPVVSDSLHLTVGNISISLPIYATLESASGVALLNGGFDDWLSSTSPSGWINASGVSQETIWGGSGNALKMVSGATLQQDVSSLLTPGVNYSIVCQIAHLIGTPDGTLTMSISGTGMTTQSFTLDTSTVTYNGWYQTITGKLMRAVPAIPSDAKLTLSYTGASSPLWLDSLTMLSDYQSQLIGPNELDAMDGLAPVATITSSNMNAQTKSTYTGTPQYNPGQDHLVFFKQSVTLTSNVPPENQIVRISYRAAGPAVGRVVDGSSVTTESTLFGDNGIRSVVRKDLTPRPRTSFECELAAKSIVSENSFQHYEGTYTQYNLYFPAEPKSGMPITFQHLPGIPFLSAEEVNEVRTTILSKSPVELFSHQLSFGKPDHIRRLLAKMLTPIDSYQNSADYEEPTLVDVSNVGSNYLPDVVKPSLRNWDDKLLYIDAGQDLSAGATGFEIRYTDSGWGTGAGKNLALVTTNRYFTVQRNARGRTFFIRQVGAAGITSRWSACMNVAFPVVVSNQYIRDWSARTIDTAQPLITGTDMSQNRYRVDVDFGEQVRLDSWSATVKTKPTVSLLSFDLLASEDQGLSWVSLFPVSQGPKIPANSVQNTGTLFQNRFLEHGNLLRYDCLQADGIGGGLEIVLKGRVFTIGDSPIGVYSGSGTGSLGAPSGSVSIAGTVTNGIAAEYLMNEGGGTTVHDTSGLVRNGFFYTQQPSWDASNTALDFTAHSAKAVMLPNNTMGIDNSSVTDFSVEVWVKPINVAGNNGGYVFHFCNGALTLLLSDSGAALGSSTAGNITAPWSSPYGHYHQLVFTRSGTSLVAYHNGTQVATASGASINPLQLGTADAKFLGANPNIGGATACSMALGEVRLYVRALSSADVTTNYNARHSNYGL